MARSTEEYLLLLQSLFPKGPFWEMVRNTESTMYQVLYGLSAEWNRVEILMENLILEANTNTVDDLLEEFEADFGLPLDGFDLADTEEQRKKDVQAALIKVGQQNKEYFIEIAEKLGWTVTIEEFQPFFAGHSVAGGACGDNYNLFYWKIWITIISGMNWNIERLIAEINGVKPGHTITLFDFKGAAFNRGFVYDFNRIQHFDNSWYPYLSFDRCFDNNFTNNSDYDGVNYTGAFFNAFSINFDRHSGGAFKVDNFGNGFTSPH